jgi:demethylmenaquinone methyltransferase / 2-methoxy-6-polyprenyl-1,4-benzoquinol methylase
MVSENHNMDKTHFGYKEVATGEKASMVKDVFESVATRYDIMNDIMSGGLHRIWKASLIDQMRPRPGMRLLDVAGGTGDVAFRFLEAASAIAARSPADPADLDTVTVCDINKAMLDVGRDRAIDKGILSGIDWVCGDAEALPMDASSFDLYTIAFGIRNVTHIERALEEAYRVLRPGGRFFCLEFSPLATPGLDKIYQWYSFKMIPKMGELITKDRESYQYLVESIRRFPRPKKFAAMIASAGFAHTGYRNMSGGVVALHSAIKA